MKNKINVESIEIDEIHTRYVKKMGNGAIIYFLKEHIGKKVYVIIPKEKARKKIKVQKYKTK
jgi:putative transposon-encoded protein